MYSVEDKEARVGVILENGKVEDSFHVHAVADVFGCGRVSHPLEHFEYCKIAVILRSTDSAR